MVSSSTSFFPGNLLLFISLLFAVLLTPPAAAVLDSSVPPQSPTALLDGDNDNDNHEAEAPFTTTPAAAPDVIKASAGRLQEAIQDLPLEETPLGFAAPALDAASAAAP